MPEEDLRGLIAQVAGMVKQMQETQKSMHSENSSRGKHIAQTADEMKEILNSAFPGGDAEGHRRYHEELIEEKAARKQLWRDLRTELASKGLWSFLALAGAAFWFYFKDKFFH